MKKKIIVSILLVFCLISSSGLVLAQTNEINKTMKVQYLIDNKIVEGRTTEEEGKVDYALDKNITRAEVSKMLVHLLDLEDLADTLKGVVLEFTDVKADHWASGYINAITTENSDPRIGRRIIVGYPDGKFLPERDVTLDEFTTMLVRICKKDLTAEDEKNAVWATSYMAWAADLGLLEDIDYTDSRKRISREDAFVMIFNARQILGMNKENKVYFGDKLSIVSKYQAGTFEVNQDKEKLYKINKNTIYINTKPYYEEMKKSIQVGSLIRFIADEDGNVQWIMELGNPEDLAIPGNWDKIAKEIVSAKNDTYFTSDATETYEITVGGVKALINKNTELFAADEKNNILGPIKDPGQVFEHFVKYRRPIKDVYMGYTDYKAYKEAKVIVFNQVDLYQGKEELRRITTPVTSDYKFNAESMIGGVEKSFDLVESGVFPGDLDLDFMDVILMRFDSYESSKLTERPKKLIDYSRDPIYKVQSYDGKLLVLRDQYDRELPLLTKQTAIFRPGELKEGDHVQVLILPPQFLIDLIGQDKLMDLDLGNLDLNKIDLRDLLRDIRIEDIVIALESIHSIHDLDLQAMAVSIVPDDLRGPLPIGYKTGPNRTFVKEVYKDSAVVGTKVDGIFVDNKVYQFFPGDRIKLELAKFLDLELVYSESYINGLNPYMVGIEFYFDYEKFTEISDDVLEKILTSSIANKIDLDKLVTLVHRIEDLDLSEELKIKIKYVLTMIYLND